MNKEEYSPDCVDDPQCGCRRCELFERLTEIVNNLDDPLDVELLQNLWLHRYKADHQLKLMFSNLRDYLGYKPVVNKTKKGYKRENQRLTDTIEDLRKWAQNSEESHTGQDILHAIDWYSIPKADLPSFDFGDPDWEKKQLARIHKLCSNNRESLAKSKFCGCFYCRNIFSPDKIQEWSKGGKSAICPCGIDSILASADISVSLELLDKMYNRYFTKQIKEEDHEL